MLIDLDPNAPVLLHAGAFALHWLHAGGGAAGLASGAAAAVARKGSRVHRWAGHVFFVSMLSMAGVGGVVAAFKEQRISTLAGLFTCYLVATAWATVRRPPGQAGRFEVGSAVFGLGVAALGFTFAGMAFASPTGRLDGLPGQPPLVFGALALLGALCDVRVARQGGVIGPARTTRHLWRMCAALLIAALSFVSQPAAVPDAVQGQPWLFLPILALAVMLVVWLVRYRPRPRKRPGSAATSARA